MERREWTGRRGDIGASGVGLKDIDNKNGKRRGREIFVG